MRIIGVWVFALLTMSLQGQGLRINEVVSKNYGVIYDDAGDDADWIELYNESTEPINLYDYFLSDDQDDLIKWRLPNTYLNPGAFLIVFAGGTSNNLLASNFSISSKGETIYLYNGYSLQSLAVPKLLANQSYGIGHNGLTYYQVASPGLANAFGVPIFSSCRFL